MYVHIIVPFYKNSDYNSSGSALCLKTTGLISTVPSLSTSFSMDDGNACFPQALEIYSKSSCHILGRFLTTVT